MFGLIPMVITIILAAIVAGAFAYFGGDIYSESSISATANGYINEASQIRSASQLYRVNESAWPGDGTTIGDGVSTLVTGDYLGGAPTHDYLVDGSGKVVAVTDAGDNADLTADVCGKIQDGAIGDPTVPAAEPTSQLFGCWDNAGTLTMFHQ